MELEALREIGEKIELLISRYHVIKEENSNLKREIAELNERLEILETEKSRWESERREMTGRLRDPEKEERIRQHLQSILGRLAEIES
jgi:septation ring formation regulator EzrA